MPPNLKSCLFAWLSAQQWRSTMSPKRRQARRWGLSGERDRNGPILRVLPLEHSLFPEEINIPSSCLLKNLFWNLLEERNCCKGNMVGKLENISFHVSHRTHFPHTSIINNHTHIVPTIRHTCTYCFQRIFKKMLYSTDIKLY